MVKPSLYGSMLNNTCMGERIQKFDFMNLTVRGYLVLLLAKKRGCVCTQDVRRLYALSKRSKRAVKFLKNMVKNGLLREDEEDVYVLTPKAEAAIKLIQVRVRNTGRLKPPMFQGFRRGGVDLKVKNR